MGYTRVVSHPEIVGFQKVIRKKNKIMIFFIIINFPTFILFTGNLV